MVPRSRIERRELRKLSSATLSNVYVATAEDTSSKLSAGITWCILEYQWLMLSHHLGSFHKLDLDYLPVAETLV